MNEAFESALPLECTYTRSSENTAASFAGSADVIAATRASSAARQAAAGSLAAWSGVSPRARARTGRKRVFMGWREQIRENGRNGRMDFRRGSKLTLPGPRARREARQLQDRDRGRSLS